MSDHIIEIKKLTKIYQDKANTVRALDDLSLTINRGEVLGLLGVNGAGKTTLSSILATLHPATSGQVLFNGVSIYDDLYAYRRKLGFCPQKPNLDPSLNVRDNLLFAARYYLLPEKEAVARTNELLDQFNLNRYATFQVNQLSGGWKQRVLIARALVHRPDIVLLDEPTVGLDPDIRRNLWDVIKSLRDEGITIVLTTHYLDEAEVLADRVTILNKGRHLLTETVSDLRGRHANERLEDVFIKLTQEQED
jgi:ABC-2 type transport system ATP-binding protein